MTTIDVETLPAEPPLGDYDIAHTFCCRNEDVLLCGLDGAGLEEGSDLDPRCVECERMDEAGWCPILGSCPEEVDFD